MNETWSVFPKGFTISQERSRILINVTDVVLVICIGCHRNPNVYLCTWWESDVVKSARTMPSVTRHTWRYLKIGMTTYFSVCVLCMVCTYVCVCVHGAGWISSCISWQLSFEDRVSLNLELTSSSHASHRDPPASASSAPGLQAHTIMLAFVCGRWESKSSL